MVHITVVITMHSTTTYKNSDYNSINNTSQRIMLYTGLNLLENFYGYDLSIVNRDYKKRRCKFML